MSSKTAPFTFVDLFAGIGGFHAALSAFGGECVYAVEKDPEAAAVYERNWGIDRARRHRRRHRRTRCSSRRTTSWRPASRASRSPSPASSAAWTRPAAPCSGTSARSSKSASPTVVLLENVRNIAGPRHTHEWDVIIRSLRELGYRVSSQADRLLAAPAAAGARRPSTGPRARLHHGHVRRHRARRTSTSSPAVPHAPVDGWDPNDWDLDEHLPLQADAELADTDCSLRLTASRDRPGSTPGTTSSSRCARPASRSCPASRSGSTPSSTRTTCSSRTARPDWKANFLRKNAEFYTKHQRRPRGVAGALGLPPRLPGVAAQVRVAGPGRRVARRHGDAPPPVGLRAKRATYVPALVAITQTSILGDRRRRLSPREAARLQGLPEWFDFGDQPDAATYKQAGNGVNVGAAYHVFREHVPAQPEAVGKRAPQPRRRGRRLVEPRPTRGRDAPTGRHSRHSSPRRVVRRPSRPEPRASLGWVPGELGQHRLGAPPLRPQEEGHRSRDRAPQGAARRRALGSGCTASSPRAARRTS